MVKTLTVVFWGMLVFCSSHAFSARLDIQLTIPKLDVEPYHRPYIAVWLETSERKAVESIAVWHGKDTWLKDMRQWWRKIGRGQERVLDGVTGPSRRPGQYKIEWHSTVLPKAKYLLNFEASREEGDRTYIRKEVDFSKQQQWTIPADGEFGEIRVTVSPSQ